MRDIQLSNDSWGKIRGFLPQESYAYVGRDESSCRRFVEVVKWKSKREYDTWLYHKRHLIECCFNKLRRFRRIFLRFDKTGSLLWLRWHEKKS